MRTSNEKIPVLVVSKNATLREMYAKARQEFTAADLQKFTEIDEGIPMERIIAELEKIHRQETRKREGRRRKKT
jgi:hypothetical protein